MLPAGGSSAKGQCSAGKARAGLQFITKDAYTGHIIIIVENVLA